MQTNSPVISKFSLGDMTIAYLKDDKNRVGLMCVPSSKAEKASYNPDNMDPIVQLHIRGDVLASGFINGHTLSGTATTDGFIFDSQNVEKECDFTHIVTCLKDFRGNKLQHKLSYQENTRAFSVSVSFENGGENPIVLDYISSFSLGNLTPFGGKHETDKLVLHRARSWWSAEGRIESGAVENYHLESSWSGFGTRCEKFGQTGSMPVRRYFPFAAVEDAAENVTWAVQIACPSSWQIEFRRSGGGFFVDGGLADHDFGHWCKTINPGEKFETPMAILTVGEGGLDKVCQRLIDLHPHSEILTGEKLPVVFNEYCTTWGNPSEENIRKILDRIKGRGLDYFVIDAGWYGNGDWGLVGDWYINENMFPNGLATVVQAIKDANLKPGIWFELENCTSRSAVAAEHPDWVLKRYGYPIDTGSRMFLNMSMPEVQAHLKKHVIDHLNKYGFKYIKVDYNDTIGMGCDDPDGLGEGLRKNMLASQAFFRRMHAEVDDLVIENCSSGGHRLEQSMMALCDMASFSDAHECVQIPVIAANLHRLIQPAKSQIWAVLRRDDSLRRINYSLVNTMLGVMCISGDVYNMSEEQWACTQKAIDFYKAYSHIIKRGESAFFGTGTENYGDPTGWQAVSRYNDKTGETLLIVHTFGGDVPGKVRIPVNAETVLDVVCSENNCVCVKDGFAEIELKANFEAIAIALK